MPKPSEKRLTWETLYKLRDRSHGTRNGFCSNCTNVCDPDTCPIWASLEDVDGGDADETD